MTICCKVENPADWSSGYCHGTDKSWMIVMTTEVYFDDVRITTARRPRPVLQTMGTARRAAVECSLSRRRVLLSRR